MIDKYNLNIFKKINVQILLVHYKNLIFNQKKKRDFLYMESNLLMRIFKEDMPVQDYFQWLIEAETPILVNFLSLSKPLLI